jgi:hypothetical protein
MKEDREVGHEAYMRQKISSYKIWVGKPEGSHVDGRKILKWI